ncbi:SMI1/KNR4 family protein [Aquirhabdus parva]|uniref:SMI1/KNR4 family protein n=1 Tax=Aquirhabdus parva TaxID=2283318 RepID=A0A345PBA2_9GAMM|nr:SMI1/KNR4 family protein [Aquirhabdus parva]
MEDQQLNDLKAQFNEALPEDYIELLRFTDGLTLKSGLIIYSSQNIFERNETLEVRTYAPNYLAIGDDSGGRSILIPFHGMGVYLVDQGSLDPRDMKKISQSLNSWLLDGLEFSNS